MPLARRVLDGYAVPFAVATFAIGAPFIRYCAEVKQYGIDMAAVIAMSLLALRLRDPDSTTGRCVRTGIVGAVLVWFSQVAVFALAGLGAALLLAWLIDRDRPTRRALLVAVPVWAIASLAAALVGLRLIAPDTRAFMDRFWRFRGGFPPWPIRKPADLLWLWDRTTQLFGDDMVLRYLWPALYGAVVAAGLIVLWRRNRAGALVVLGPFAVAVAAAVAQLYPFRTRLVLYVLPGLVLALAEGAEWLRRTAARLHPALGAACMALLFVAGPAWAFVRVPPPYFVEDYKTVLAFVRAHRQPGDAVFVTPIAGEAVERYGPAYGLAPGDYQVGSCSAEDRRVMLREVDRYRGRPRVWVVASAVPPYQAAARGRRELPLGDRRAGTFGRRAVREAALPRQRDALRPERSVEARGGLGGDVSAGAAGSVAHDLRTRGAAAVAPGRPTSAAAPRPARPAPHGARAGSSRGARRPASTPRTAANVTGSAQRVS